MATRKHNHHRRTRASVARTESKTLKLFNHQSRNHLSNHRMLKNVSLHSVSKDIMSQQNKFQNSWPQIASQGFKNRFKKMWEYYFSYCEVGFTEGTTDVSHFIITK